MAAADAAMDYLFNALALVVTGVGLRKAELLRPLCLACASRWHLAGAIQNARPRAMQANRHSAM